MVDMNEVTMLVSYDDNKIFLVNEKLDINETYSLNEIPQNQSMIIQQDKSQIYQGLQISSIIANLNNAAGLMLVAATALTGTKLSSKMSALQKDLLDICGSSSISITTFADRSKAISQYIIKAYDWLIKGKEDVALKQFARCSDQAKKMADEAESLAKSFERIADETENVLEATQDEQALQYEKIEQLKRELAQYTAELEKQQENQKLLLDDIEKINETYEELRQKENKMMDRQFGLQITSALTSVLSAGISAFSPCFGAKTDSRDSLTDALEKELQKQTTELELLQKDKVENETKKEELETEKAETEKELLALNEKQKDESTMSEINTMMQTLASCDIQMKLVMTAIDAATQKINEISEKMKETSEKLNEISKSMQSDIERVNAEKQSILNKKLEMEKERRDALMDIKKFTVFIEDNSGASDTAQTAVETLQVAVKCLKQIVVSLSNAALFWRSMQRYCETLSSDGAISMEIEDIMDAYEEDERIQMYREPAFMLSMLQYLCKWSALYYVSIEYLEETKKVREQVSQNIKFSPTKEEAQQIAPKMAADMGNRIELQIKEADELIQYIEGE